MLVFLLTIFLMVCLALAIGATLAEWDEKEE